MRAWLSRGEVTEGMTKITAMRRSGVDLFEKNLKHSKRGYAEYIANTPAFFPGWNFWILLLGMSSLAVTFFLL
jgi:steroid 5-alpha reductase family enzyme